MKNFVQLFAIFLIFTSCESQEKLVYVPINTAKYNYLALGDSYTIGESVCIDCRFPEQLKTALQNKYTSDDFGLQIIAQTGWTTSNLIGSINRLAPKNNFDLVTLLIGVNNQYQNRPFSLYETEFPDLVNRSIALAKGDKTNVIVVSIPDYAYTTFGAGSLAISNKLLE